VQPKTREQKVFQVGMEEKHSQEPESTDEDFVKFQNRQETRFIVVAIIGGILTFLLMRIPPNTIDPSLGMLGLIGIGTWLVSLLYLGSRVRGKYESKGPYKRRVHYNEPDRTPRR